MTAAPDILCLAHLPWDGPWKAYHQIISRMADHHRVFCVDPAPGLRAALRLTMSGDGRGNLRWISERQYLYRAPWWQGRTRLRAVDRLIEPVRLRHALRTARRYEITPAILWVFEPWLASYVELFQARLVVYHVVDDYIEYLKPSATRERARLARHHEALLRRADVVFAVSKRLEAKCRPFNSATYCVPNGVDFERFHRASRDGYIPEDLRGIRRPIVGYVGVVEPKLDVALLGRVAAARPDWSVVVIGPAYPAPAEHLRTLGRWCRNLHYLGAKRPEEVPSYVGALDVAVLADREQTDGDSIKLYEYLACGRPVVSIDPGSVEQVGALVFYAPDDAAFILGIEQALAEPGDAMHARVEFARTQTWQGRVETVRAVIAQHLNSGPRRGVRVDPPLGEIGAKRALHRTEAEQRT